MENHKDCCDFDICDLKLKPESLISQQLVVPPRINRFVSQNPTYNYNSYPIYPNNYYGMGNMNLNLQNPVFGNASFPKMDNVITDSFSSISSVVQTINALNTLVNTAYGTMYTSITTIAGVTDQMNRTKIQLFHILNSVNFLHIIKKLILFLKKIFSGDLPKMSDLTSFLVEMKNKLQSNFSSSANNILSCLFFMTIICGPIVIFKFLKSMSLKTEKNLPWNSQIGKSYAAKVKGNFASRSPDELNVFQGEIVTIAPPEFQKEVNWYLVSNLKGEQGLIPSSFVSVIGVLNKNKNNE